MKAVKKWEAIKNKAQMIADNQDAAPATKLREIKKLYGAGKKGKKFESKVYVIAGKMRGKSASQSKKKGAKTVLVDRTMLKEKRIKQMREKKHGKPGARKGSKKKF